MKNVVSNTMLQCPLFTDNSPVPSSNFLSSYRHFTAHKVETNSLSCWSYRLYIMKYTPQTCTTQKDDWLTTWWAALPTCQLLALVIKHQKFHKLCLPRVLTLTYSLHPHIPNTHSFSFRRHMSPPKCWHSCSSSLTQIHHASCLVHKFLFH